MILKHHAKIAPVLCATIAVERRDIDPVHLDLSHAGAVQTQQKLQECGLACARVAGQEGHGAFFKADGDVLQRFESVRIALVNTTKFYAAQGIYSGASKASTKASAENGLSAS